jgi:uncharacterized protein YndB with AHSA1/START domain
MRTVNVETTIPAPIEAVFDLVTDHANYSRFRSIQHSELLRPGELEPNGVGALRRIHSRPLRFEEEITAFERPTRMDYLIRKVNAPLNHQGGSMVLEQRDGATHITWTSTFEFTPRVIGGLVTRVAAPLVSFSFRSVLRDVERLLADPGAYESLARSGDPARSRID